MSYLSKRLTNVPTIEISEPEDQRTSRGRVAVTLYRRKFYSLERGREKPPAPQNDLRTSSQPDISKPLPNKHTLNVFQTHSMTPLRYFKKIAFIVKVLVILQKKILSHREDKSTWSRVETQTVIEQQLSQALEWKLSIINAPKTSTGSYIQEVLAMPPHQRTILSEARLLRYLKRLHTIQDFPLSVQTQIAKYMKFQTYGPGRVIIKESHPSLSVYFIWSGSVFINQKEKDVRDNSTFNVTVNVLKAGDWFGEKGVLYNTRHTVTIISRTHVELLVIDDIDFRKILAHSVLNKTQIMIKYLSELPTLLAWPIETLSSTPNMVYAKYFRYNSIIMKYSPFNTSEWTVIIKSGGCRMIIEFTEEHYKSKGSVRLPLVPPRANLTATSEDRKRMNGKHKNTKRKFLQLGTMEPGDVFGLQLLYNKPSCRINLVSRGSECVFVNKQFFLQHSTDELVQLYSNETGFYPEKHKLIKAIRDRSVWSLYKQCIVNELV